MAPMDLMKRAAAIFDAIVYSLAIAAAVMVMLMMLGITTHVVARYLFRSPIQGTLEISGYFLLFITLLGATWLLREEGHVRVDLLFNRLSARTQAVLNLVTSSIGAMVCLVLLWYGVVGAKVYYVNDTRSFTPLMIPLVFVISVIPLSSFLLFIQFLRRGYGNLMLIRAAQTEASEGNSRQ